jgi:hypothetical protein
MVNYKTFCGETNWKSVFVLIISQHIKIWEFWDFPFSISAMHDDNITHKNLTCFPTIDSLDHTQSPGRLLPMTTCRSSVCTKDCREGDFFGRVQCTSGMIIWAILRLSVKKLIENLFSVWWYFNICKTWVLRFSVICWCHLVPCVMTTSHIKIFSNYWYHGSHSKPRGLLPMTMCMSSVCAKDSGEGEFFCQVRCIRWTILRLSE